MIEEENTYQKLQTEALKQFNEFQSQTRLRVEATIKAVFLVSGGMLTLSIGAVLGDGSSNVPQDLLPTLKCAWSMLFYSISAALLLMLLLVISTFHMGIRWSKKLTTKDCKVETISTWGWLRIVNWAVGVSSVVACLAGVGLMALVAIGVASSNLGT